jgi:hypothetical protein
MEDIGFRGRKESPQSRETRILEQLPQIEPNEFQAKAKSLTDLSFIDTMGIQAAAGSS